VVFERRASQLTREALGARLFGPEGLALTPPRAASGSTAQLSLAGTRRRFEVQYARLPTSFFGMIPNLGGALLLVEMEPGRTGPVHTGLSLSTWELDSTELQSLRAGLRAMADAVFGPGRAELPGLAARDAPSQLRASGGAPPCSSKRPPPATS
jgi:hypothetical protein